MAAFVSSWIPPVPDCITTEPVETSPPIVIGALLVARVPICILPDVWESPAPMSPVVILSPSNSPVELVAVFSVCAIFHIRSDISEHVVKMDHGAAHLDEASTLPSLYFRSGSHPSCSVGHPNASYNTIETVQVGEEAPWDQPGEDLVQDWLETSKQQAAIHRGKGFRLKRRYKFFGILSIITASIVFLFSNIVVSLNLSIDTFVHVFVAFINLIVANLVQFLEYGPRYQRQFEFEGKYSKLAVDLTEILATDIEFRSPKDRVLAEHKEKIGNLMINAPEV